MYARCTQAWRCRSGPATVRLVDSSPAHRHAHQARGGDLRREHLFRPLFRHLSTADQPAGEPKFTAAAARRRSTGCTDALLTNNPNLTNAANGTGVSNPFRLDRTQAATADQNHDYTAEQQAYDHGPMDLFPKFTGTAGTAAARGRSIPPGLVMGYYDGNTVTALWNYAQHFAMSDNSYSDQYGPSTPGAINLISGQTNGFSRPEERSTGYFIATARVP